MIKHVIDSNENIEMIANMISNKKSYLYKALIGRDDLSVLDLGCSVPDILYRAHCGLGADKCVGIDKKPGEKQCLEELANRLIGNHEIPDEVELGKRIKRDFSVFYDYFKYKYKGYTLLSKSDFENTILKNIKFKTEIQEFVKDQNEQFDLIICSLVLHFTLHEEQLITKMKSLLKKNGLIHIRIQNHGNLYTKEGFIAELDKNFTTGTILESKFPDSVEWHQMTFMNWVED